MAEIMAGNKSRDCWSLTDSRASELSGAASLGVNEQLLLVFVTGKLSCGIQFPVQKRRCICWSVKGNIKYFRAYLICSGQ